MDDDDQSIEVPLTDDLDGLAQQFVVVDQLARAHLGHGLARDDGDLATLQALLDAGVPAADQTYQLQCLGVVLGLRLAAHVDGLTWAVVDDADGRAPALRYRDTELLVFPLTILSKQIEDGDDVDVAATFAGLCERIEELKAEVDGTAGSDDDGGDGGDGDDGGS